MWIDNIVTIDIIAGSFKNEFKFLG